MSRGLGDVYKRQDMDASEKILDGLSAEQRKNVILLKEPYSAPELKYLISKCDFFIGARMHACIAALSQSVPAVGIAYSQKFKGVFAGIDADDLVVDPRLLSYEMALSACERLFEEREKWKQHLLQRIPDVVKQVLEIAGTIQIQDLGTKEKA